MEENEVLLTEEGYRKLEEELTYLKGPKKLEVADKLKVAREYGDLSENSEYDEAKNEQALLEAKIAEMEIMLNSAKIVDKDGNLCPDACNRLTFKAEGSVDVYATDAGDQRETEAFLRADKKALTGMVVCCVRNNHKNGTATVSSHGEGLIFGTVSFECK